jgi:HlyD family secretion protein
MEHIHGNVTLAVLARFIRRYWRVPAQLAGLTAIVLVLLIVLPFLPRPEARVEAASSPRAAETAATVESLFAKGIGAPFTGAVKEVRVTRGQAVKKNDLLFVMDASTLQPQLAAARTAVAEAQNNVQLTLSMRHQELAPIAQQRDALQSQIAREEAALLAPPAELTAPVEGTPAGELQPAAPEQPTDGASEAGFTAAPTAYRGGDSPRLQELRAQLGATQSRLAEQQQAWAQPLAEARQRVAAANGEVRRIRRLIATATRRSPIDGVVTQIDIKTGEWANAGTRVVRIDNPKGYRIVTQVDQKVRDSVKLGEALPVSVAGSAVPGKLEKIVPGEDKELGTYYLWMKPNQPEKLLPNQQVSVTVPAVTTNAAE